MNNCQGSPLELITFSTQYKRTKDYVTPEFFSRIKGDHKRGEPRQVFYWKFGGFISNPSIVALAPLEIPNIPDPLTYFQVAVRFESLQVNDVMRHYSSH